MLRSCKSIPPAGKAVCDSLPLIVVVSVCLALTSVPLALAQGKDPGPRTGAAGAGRARAAAVAHASPAGGEIELPDLLLQGHFLQKRSGAARCFSAHDRGLSRSASRMQNPRANRNLQKKECSRRSPRAQKHCSCPHG